MKPTPRISPGQHVSRRFPSTDYTYQATAEARTAALPKSTKRPAFYELSSQFLAAEANRHFLVELLSFTLISGTAAWPVISALVAMVRLARNY